MYQEMNDGKINGGWTVSGESTWTRFEDKLFEQALVLFPEDVPDRWEKIADRVPGRSADEVLAHYEALVHDLLEIDSGRVDLPSYADDDDEDPGLGGWDPELRASQISFGSGGKPRHGGGGGGEGERKKGTPWSEEEHRLFLMGLERYGKGDWRSISRNVVVTRTPTQVASHAQKYYLRQSSMKKERKRSSIHDITTTAADTMTVHVPPSANFGAGGGGNGGQAFGGYQQNLGYPM